MPLCGKEPFDRQRIFPVKGAWESTLGFIEQLTAIQGGNFGENSIKEAVP